MTFFFLSVSFLCVLKVSLIIQNVKQTLLLPLFLILSIKGVCRSSFFDSFFC